MTNFIGFADVVANGGDRVKALQEKASKKLARAVTLFGGYSHQIDVTLLDPQALAADCCNNLFYSFGGGHPGLKEAVIQELVWQLTVQILSPLWERFKVIL